MSVETKTLYDTDFVEWTARTAELLRARRFDELDVEQVAEDIEDLGKSDRRAVGSQLSRILMHLLKRRIQPEREGASWRSSIVSARREIKYQLDDSPSLRRHLEDTLQRTYRGAVKDALDETDLTATAKELDIPETCPWTLNALLDGDLNKL
jgi:hypothetical protein